MKKHEQAQKRNRVKATFTFDPQLLAWLRDRAERNGRTISREVERLIIAGGQQNGGV